MPGVGFLPSEKTLIYEALGLFQGVTYDWYNYAAWVTGSYGSVPIAQQVDFGVCCTRLEAILTAITAAAPTDGRELRIKRILVEYDKIALTVPWSIESGGVEGAFGLRMNVRQGWQRFHDLLEGSLGIHVEIVESPWSGGGSRSIKVGR